MVGDEVGGGHYLLQIDLHDSMTSQNTQRPLRRTSSESAEKCRLLPQVSREPASRGFARTQLVSKPARRRRCGAACAESASLGRRTAGGKEHGQRGRGKALRTVELRTTEAACKEFGAAREGLQGPGSVSKQQPIRFATGTVRTDVTPKLRRGGTEGRLRFCGISQRC